MIAIRVVRGVTGHFMVRLVEWLNSAILLNFGLTLLGRSDTFASASLYDTMAQVASEEAWGWALTLVAGVRIAALVVNGSFVWFAQYSPWARVAMAFLSAFAWFVLSASLFASPIIPPGAGTYAIHMVSDVFVAGVLAREAARLAART